MGSRRTWCTSPPKFFQWVEGLLLQSCNICIGTWLCVAWPCLKNEKYTVKGDLLPQKLTGEISEYWNLYVDDLTILEVVSEKWLDHHKEGGLGESQLKSSMEAAYRELGVPYSREKASSRELRCEKLGALLDGKRGRLGITTARSLDFISLCIFIMGEERVPTKWRQIFLGKFVHLVQFRRPIFSMVLHSWERVARFNNGGPLTGKEVDEWFLLCMVLPMYYGRVTCSDASESGGGVCYSTGLTPLGKLGAFVGRLREVGVKPSIITFEWFAGIGGMSRALERLHLSTHQAAVCECDQDCVDILRGMLPGCEVWKDICEVTEDDIRRFFDRWPDAGLSKLSVKDGKADRALLWQPFPSRSHPKRTGLLFRGHMRHFVLWSWFHQPNSIKVDVLRHAEEPGPSHARQRPTTQEPLEVFRERDLLWILRA